MNINQTKPNPKGWDWLHNCDEFVFLHLDPEKGEVRIPKALAPNPDAAVDGLTAMLKALGEETQ